MGKGTIFFDNTTASADVARELHAAGKKIGVDFIDAPVSGGDAGAPNGARVPVTALVDQFYADVQQAGGRRWDTSSLIIRLK
jgi:3-hydroxyisobutyrate dehydrogenase-like beta-hydroxyacid dehydrogenase